MKETVSVIIPVYNVERYLPDCIRSITGQTYKELEIILVDDGSTDGSGRLCDEAATGDGRVRVIHQPNAGLSGARNAGLDAMTGSYVFFLDSDDTVLEHAVESMMGYIRDTDIVCCGIEAVDPEKGGCPLTGEGSGYFSGRGAIGSMLFDGRINSAAWAKLYRSRLFRELRFPLGKIHEDEFTTYKLLDMSEQVYYTDERLYRYLKRPGSITGAGYTERHLDRFEAYAGRALYFKEKGYIPEYEFTIIRIIDEAYHVVRSHREYRERIRQLVKDLDLHCLSFRVYPRRRLIRYEVKRMLTL
ncbi:MAG: glycosyltransferase [Lachnospiraceae bacterium]|nr:glycosyltransferase [Lachnospiraceae bacterium]